MIVHNEHTASVAGVILAAGSGQRLNAETGGTLNKVYLPLAGRPVIAWSLEAFAAHPQIDPLVLVIRPDDRELAEEVIANHVTRPVEIVLGAAERHLSEQRALTHLKTRIHNGQIDTVAIHDGSRPLVTPKLIDNLLIHARQHGGAVPYLPIMRFAEPSDRAGLQQLAAVQTPQIFTATPLLAAYEHATADGFHGTDTSSYVEHYAKNLSIKAVLSDPTNIKVTFASDIPYAEELLAQRFSKHN